MSFCWDGFGVIRNQSTKSSVSILYPVIKVPKDLLLRVCLSNFLTLFCSEKLPSLILSRKDGRSPSELVKGPTRTQSKDYNALRPF